MLHELKTLRMCAQLDRAHVVDKRLIVLALGRQVQEGRDRSEEQLLTVDQAAHRLSVPREWLYRRCERLGLAVKLADGTLRISNIALDAYIMSRTISPASGRHRRSLFE
jgi:hypothetical protein